MQHVFRNPRSIAGAAALAALALGASAGAQAAEPASCQAVRFADVGWTDITATTAVVSEILKGIGYKPSAQVLSVPVTYRSMKDKKIDVFLGNWMPSMEADIKPYAADGSVETIGANLEGAKYTLAVPDYVAEPVSKPLPISPKMPTNSRKRFMA